MGLFRFYLALSVLVGHSTGGFFGFPILGGHPAVESFFVISGFYMAFIYKEKYSTKKNGNFLFLSNRYLRIFPVYWSVFGFILVTALYSSIYIHINYFADLLFRLNTNNLNIFSLIYIGIANLFIFGQGIGNFLVLSPHSKSLLLTNNPFGSQVIPLYFLMVIPQAWTIELELLFYLTVPFIMKLKKLGVIFLIILSLLLRVNLYIWKYDFDPWTYRFFPLEFAIFCFGIIAYYVYRHYQKIKYNRTPILLLTIALSFASLLLFIYIKGEIKTVLRWIYYCSLIFSIPSLFVLSKKINLDRLLGELSYPMYLTHLAVINILNITSATTVIPTRFFSSVVLLLSIVISLILVKLVIDPINQFRQRRI